MTAYSVLDLAVVTEGRSISETIQNSRDLAVHAEAWGYNRFWMAEHHNMDNIASSATSVLLGHMAEATNAIRIGSGGIMLPNHSPLVIAEQFGTLASIYPDRIDLGVGRAPGTDQTTADAIRPDRMRQIQQFPENVRQLQQYLSERNHSSKVRAIPGEGTDVPIWILGSSPDSAYLAAEFGLPYSFASHFAPQHLTEALKIYHENFTPSGQLSEPYTMPCVNVVVADSDEHAQYLAGSMKLMFRGVISGRRDPMPPPVENADSKLSPQEKMAVDQMMTYTFIGSKSTVAEKLTAFIEATQANEIMMASYVYDHSERLKSHRLFAEMMQETGEAV